MSIEISLAGQVALVTGAAGGVGAAVARRARQGRRRSRAHRYG